MNSIDWIVIFLADYLIWFLLAAIVVQLWHERRGGAVSLVVTIFAVWLVATAIQVAYDHPRPFLVDPARPALVSAARDNSFPSVHAAVMAAAATWIRRRRPREGAWLLLGAAVVGAGRVAAGVHWPLDVVTGFALGVLMAWWIERMGLDNSGRSIKI